MRSRKKKFCKLLLINLEMTFFLRLDELSQEYLSEEEKPQEYSLTINHKGAFYAGEDWYSKWDFNCKKCSSGQCKKKIHCRISRLYKARYYCIPDGKKRADRIAKWLGTATNHKTHGRPIPCNVAKSQGLNVIELEPDPELQEKALSVFHSSIVTIEITNCIKIIENQNGKGTYIQVNIK